jgi:hypothetical protein
MRIRFHNKNSIVKENVESFPRTIISFRFEKVLVDDRIIRLVPQLLGKPFYKKKKLPVAVNLVAKKLKEEVVILVIS